MDIPQTAAFEKLIPALELEWRRFLWRYRKTSQFLRKYLAWGPDRLDHYRTAEIGAKVDRIVSWMPEAKAAFLRSETRIFWECSILDHKARPKHWRPVGFSEGRVQRESAQNAEGIFMPGMSVPLIRDGLWCLFAKCFEQAKRRKLRFGSCDFGLEIGFSRGEPTSIARYDIDYSSAHAHAYPISRQEAAKYPRVSIDELGLEIRRRDSL